MSRTVPVGKVPNVTRQFNAAAKPAAPVKTPKLNHNLKPPRVAGPAPGGPARAGTGTPLRRPLKTAPARPTQAFARAAAKPVPRATPAFNKAAAPARTPGHTRSRTR